MRGVFGPILTTGVVLVTAAVVAANPVMGANSDIQIRPIDLSSVPADMFDQAFLDAIAPASPGATGPLAALKGLVGALAADAAYLGRNGVTRMSTAGGDGRDGLSPAELSDLAGIRPATPSPTQAPGVDPDRVAVQALAATAAGAHNATPLIAGESAGPIGPEALSATAHDIVNVELPKTLDAVASLVSAVPLTPPVIADSISALGQRLADLPVGASVANSSSAGDSPESAWVDPSRRSTQPLSAPAAPPRLSASPGAEGDPAGGGTSQGMHRPWRPGAKKPGSGFSRGSGGVRAATAPSPAR